MMMDENQPKSKHNFLAISILLAAVIIGGSLIYSAGLKATRGTLAQVSGGKPAVPTKDDDVILGDPKAPITLLIFGDYQCPFCAAATGHNPEVIKALQARIPLWQPAEPNIIEHYVKSGKVNMVFRDFPLDSIHPYARKAAEAAECARDQGKYWAYHDYLYAHQDTIPTIDYVAVAGTLGMDATAFKTCFDGEKYAKEVEKDYQDGLAAGVEGTPGNFILSNNGKDVRVLPGADSYETFKRVIDEILSKS